eukprot:g17128.t1
MSLTMEQVDAASFHRLRTLAKAHGMSAAGNTTALRTRLARYVHFASLSLEQQIDQGTGPELRTLGLNAGIKLPARASTEQIRDILRARAQLPPPPQRKPKVAVAVAVGILAAAAVAYSAIFRRGTLPSTTAVSRTALPANVDLTAVESTVAVDGSLSDFRAEGDMDSSGGLSVDDFFDAAVPPTDPAYFAPPSLELFVPSTLASTAVPSPDAAITAPAAPTLSELPPLEMEPTAPLAAPVVEPTCDSGDDVSMDESAPSTLPSTTAPPPAATVTAPPATFAELTALEVESATLLAAPIVEPTGDDGDDAGWPSIVKEICCAVPWCAVCTVEFLGDGGEDQCSSGLVTPTQASVGDGGVQPGSTDFSARTISDDDEEDVRSAPSPTLDGVHGSDGDVGHTDSTEAALFMDETAVHETLSAGGSDLAKVLSPTVDSAKGSGEDVASHGPADSVRSPDEVAKVPSPTVDIATGSGEDVASHDPADSARSPDEVAKVPSPTVDIATGSSEDVASHAPADSARSSDEVAKVLSPTVDIAPGSGEDVALHAPADSVAWSDARVASPVDVNNGSHESMSYGNGAILAALQEINAKQAEQRDATLEQRDATLEQMAATLEQRWEFRLALGCMMLVFLAAFLSAVWVCMVGRAELKALKKGNGDLSINVRQQSLPPLPLLVGLHLLLGRPLIRLPHETCHCAVKLIDCAGKMQLLKEQHARERGAVVQLDGTVARLVRESDERAAEKQVESDQQREWRERLLADVDGQMQLLKEQHARERAKDLKDVLNIVNRNADSIARVTVDVKNLTSGGGAARAGFGGASGLGKSTLRGLNSRLLAAIINGSSGGAIGGLRDESSARGGGAQWGGGDGGDGGGGGGGGTTQSGSRPSNRRNQHCGVPRSQQREIQQSSKQLGNTQAGSPGGKPSSTTREDSN